MARPRIRPPEHSERADAAILAMEESAAHAEAHGYDPRWLDLGDPIPPRAVRPGHWPGIGRVYVDDIHGSKFYMGCQPGWSPAKEGHLRVGASGGMSQHQDYETCTVCGGPEMGTLSPGSGFTCAGCMSSDVEVEHLIVGEVVRESGRRSSAA